MKLFAYLLLCLLSTAAAAATPLLPEVQDCVNFYNELIQATDTPTGPHLYLKAEKTGLRNFDEINDLHVGQFNVGNMFNYRGKWEYTADGKLTQITGPSPKPEKRWAQLAEVINRSDDDIMVWEEVEDFAAAEEFVREKLGNKYRVVLIDGNDQRGIDIALLVKKDLPLDIEAQSHKKVPRPDRPGFPLFSRDLPVYSFRRAGADPESPPLFRIGGTHYKSKQNEDKPALETLRALQVAQTAKIIRQLEAKDPKVPFFLMGDFNADLMTAPEFEPLWDLGMKDALDLVPNPMPVHLRTSQTYFPDGIKPVSTLLDGQLVNRAARKAKLVKKAEILPFRSADGKDLPPPTSLAEREEQGSDHRKRKMTIDFQAVRENAGE